MDNESLRVEIEELFGRELTEVETARARAAAERLLEGLEAGELRAAEPAGEGWRVNAWVKKGILLAFGAGELRDWTRWTSGSRPVRIDAIEGRVQLLCE